jgi:hypothetical protein
MKYLEKLKDPRWQKVRLRIMERDGWACQRCQDSEETLVVHHRYYTSGAEPWEYPDEALVTLCWNCHESEREEMNEFSPLLIQTLKRVGFFADDMREIACGIHGLKMTKPSHVVARAISVALETMNAPGGIMDRYFDYLHKGDKK